MTPRKVELVYEERLLELVKQITQVTGKLHFDDEDFADKWSEVDLRTRLKIYNDFAELEQNILDTLRQSFVAVPTVRLVRRKNDMPPE